MKKFLHSRITAILLLSLSILLYLPSATAQDTWEKKDNFPGGARNMAVSFVIGKKAYVGLGVGAKNYKDFWEYDVTTAKWTKKADYPGKGSERAVAFTVNNKAYVGLGDTSSYQGRKFFDDLYEYDPTINTWTKKASYPGGGMAYSVGFGIGTKGYVGTGWNGNVNRDFYEYDPEMDKWSKKADFGGVARGFATGFTLNGKGYIGIGNSLEGGQNTRLRDFWEYDPKTDSWVQKADAGEEGVWDAVGFTIGDKGYIGSGTAYGTTSQFYEYDATSDQWITRANYANGKFNTGSVAFGIDGKAYTLTGQFFQDEVYEYIPCERKNFTADFSYVLDNFKISLTATKQKNLKYNWDFGDGKRDTGATAFHQYQTAGNYQVKLTLSSLCYSEVKSKTIAAEGIVGIANNRGGNIGIVTAMIQGAGLTGIYLERNGIKIQGTALQVQSDGSMQTTFNLEKQPVGEWNVVALFPDGRSTTLTGGYIVEDGTIPKLGVGMSGDNVLRVGFKQRYTITYTNTGNTDAHMVPMYLTGLPYGTKINILAPMFPVQTLPGFEDYQPITDDKRTLQDKENQSSARSVVIPKVPANSSQSVEAIFELPPDANLHDVQNIQTILGEPYKANSPEEVAIREACEKVVTDAALEYALGKVLPGEGDLLGLRTCLNSAPAKSVYQYLTRKDEPGWLDKADVTTAVVQQLIGCARVGANGAGLVGALTGNPALAIGAVAISQRLLVAQQFADQGANAVALAKLARECMKLPEPPAQASFPVIIGNAWDPNALYGPGDLSDKHYTNQRLLSYSVSFENLPEANLNAQTVTVIDTLKPQYFDVETFGFTSVTLGDKTFKLNAPAKSFIQDFDLVAKYGVNARVVANFDKTTGIAEWKIYSIDPATNQVTANALAGFLPPNKVAPEGEGFLSYQIAMKPDTKTGDNTQNKAYITFDFNPVIATNAWNNTLDDITPQSKMEKLPEFSTDTTFVIKWGGSDNLSGIRAYDIYYREDEGTFVQLLYNTKTTSVSFTGKNNHSYKFYAIAWDNAGNIETSKTVEEASITVRSGDLFTLPVNNFKLAITSVTCKGQSNGSVNITAVEQLPYTAILKGSNLTSDKTITFNKEGKFEGLASGSYQICLTVAEKDYKQCFDVVVTEPKDLAVFASVNKDNNTVNLQLSGSTNYRITVNGKFYNSSSNRLDIPLNKGSNRITVSTDLICQGIIEEVINISGNLVPYPNPVEDIMYINLGEDIVKSATLLIYNVKTGRQSGSAIFHNKSGVVQINMSNYEEGIYSVHVIINGSKSIYKVVKK